MTSYQPPPNLLDDRVLLITGAGDGIGKVLAQAAAAHGARVILLGRTTAKLTQVYDSIIEAGGPEPSIAALDLEGASQADLDELAAKVKGQYQRLDGLVHNAALLGDRVPFEQYSAAQWQSVMQVNFNAVVALTRSLLPLLNQSDQGRLLLTSSGVGTHPRAYWGAYAVSKHALEGFALLLADELDNTSRTRVNIINPGATRTAMRASAYPAEDPATLKTAESLMPLYLYLLGADSQGENGKLFSE